MLLHFLHGACVDLNTNLTVYRLGPQKDAIVLSDTDSGDELGDLNFFLPQFFLPMSCKHPIMPRAKFDCKNAERTDPNLLVTKYDLLVDTDYTGYSECNFCSTGRDPLTFRPCKKGTYVCDCPGCDHSKVGRKIGNGLYYCLPFVSNPWDCWGANIDRMVRGYWYSTLSKGHYKTWKTVSTMSVKAQCVTDAIATVVEKAGPQCFNKCGKRDYKSECWITCFFNTLLGPESSKALGKRGGGMDMNDIVNAWKNTFLPESQGGCPKVQPGMVLV